MQTVTVWKQANDKKLPCLIYANKMDHPNSDITLCERSIKEKLGVIPLVLHIPIKGKILFFCIIEFSIIFI